MIPFLHGGVKYCKASVCPRVDPPVVVQGYVDCYYYRGNMKLYIQREGQVDWKSS